jgi:hypothetical protein
VRFVLAGRANAIVKSVPKPVKAIVPGESSVFVLMVIVPVCRPIDIAAKETLIVQLPFPARVAPQLFVCEKSPVALTLLIDMGAAVLLWTLTGMGALDRL